MKKIMERIELVDNGMQADGQTRVLSRVGEQSPILRHYCPLEDFSSEVEYITPVHDLAVDMMAIKNSTDIAYCYSSCHVNPGSSVGRTIA